MKKLALTALCLSMILSTASVAAYSPERKTSVWPKDSKVITFNSTLKNPAVGDERDFLLARNYLDNQHTNYLKVSDNEEIVFRIYYHNDAAANKVAKQTMVKLNLPGVTAKSQNVTANISAENAKPLTVTDDTTVYSDQPFSLSYEPGSAQIWSNYARGAKLQDSIAREGALIGTTQMDGNIPGGSKNSGYVTVVAKVHMTETRAVPTPAGSKISNTGPGDVIGIFTGASALGAVAHRLRNSRKLAVDKHLQN